MAAAVGVGAVAMGGNALKKMGIGGYNSGKVAKDLYGKNAKQFSSDVMDNIRVRNANDIAESGMAGFKVVNKKNGPKVKATGGNPFQNAARTHLDDNVVAFNKKLKDYTNGADGVYSTSKLSLYDALFDETEKKGIGLTSKQLTGMTNEIYGSAANQNIRGPNYTLANDAEISNSIWGKGPTAREVRDTFTGMHPNDSTTEKRYKDIYKNGYNERHNSDFDKDTKTQRERSKGWRDDIKEQMRKEGVDERAKKAKDRFRAERETPDPVNKANGIFRDDVDKGNLVNDVKFNPDDFANLNKVDYVPKVKKASRYAKGSPQDIAKTNAEKARVYNSDEGIAARQRFRSEREIPEFLPHEGVYKEYGNTRGLADKLYPRPSEEEAIKKLSKRDFNPKVSNTRKADDLSSVDTRPKRPFRKMFNKLKNNISKRRRPKIDEGAIND